MRRVELRLLAGYRKFLPAQDRQNGKSGLDVQDGLTLGGLLALQGIDASRPLVVLVNGRYAVSDRVLEDGDVVSVFPPVAGG
jgi:sulfur-carrier protein